MTTTDPKLTNQPTERVASELVERIARVACGVSGERWDAANSNETLSGNEPEDVREMCRDLARAIFPILQSELAAQQAAIVAWLREQAALRFRLADECEERSAIAYNCTRGIAVEMAADEIERGKYKEQSDA